MEINQIKNRMKIDTTQITNWRIATKTKGLRAKPLVSLLVDRTVLNKFLVDTLEGKEPLGDGAVICIGESNDAWQQMPKKLLQKYEVKSIDADGWMVCEPRPDNAVHCIEVTPVMTPLLRVVPLIVAILVTARLLLIKTSPPVNWN